MPFAKLSVTCQDDLSHLIEIIHEHLAHLVDGDGGIDGAVKSQFTHSIRQSTQVQVIRVR